MVAMKNVGEEFGRMQVKPIFTPPTCLRLGSTVLSVGPKEGSLLGLVVGRQWPVQGSDERGGRIRGSH